jgi:hypothetical protein
MLTAIDGIRRRFSGAVIRRTIQSVDNTGARISGLEPYQEHLLVVDLYESELENLKGICEGLVADNARSAARFTAGRVIASRVLRLEYL